MLPPLPIALFIFYVYPLFPMPVRKAIVATLDYIIARQEKART